MWHKLLICYLLITSILLVGCQDQNRLDSTQIEQISANEQPINTEKRM